MRRSSQRCVLALAVCAAGCGRLGFDAIDIDASIDAGFGTVAQQAFLKSSLPEVADGFGLEVALSGDGSTLAVAARFEDSAATSINGDQTSNAAIDSGAVYVFVRAGASWQQQAYLKPDDTIAGMDFGFSIALSATGDVLVAGAIKGDADAGAAYVFVRAGASWTLQARLTPSDRMAGAAFGASAAMTASGDTLAIGAYAGNGGAGSAYVFERTGTAWSERARIVAPNAEVGDSFGDAIALSGDGSTMAIGSAREDSSATGIDGDPVNNDAPVAGAVFVFGRAAAAWEQRAYVKASDTAPSLQFGNQLALTENGLLLTVAAVGRAGFTGAAYVFTSAAGTWSEQARLVPASSDPVDELAWSMDLSGDGSVLVVGARGEASAASGVNGDPFDNSAVSTGAAFVFVSTATGWEERAYLKPAASSSFDLMGSGVSIAGTTIVVGANGEATSTPGIDPPHDELAPGAGAAFVFEASP